MQAPYSNQVDLLLSVLGEVVKSPDIALKGGTALNLFLLDMPRLSVDIDLCFLPILPRQESLERISTVMMEIANTLSSNFSLQTNLKKTHDQIPKQLIVSEKGVTIKIEINLILRGSVFGIEKKDLCLSAQKRYGKFLSVNCLSFEDLYAGKFCAALDRQHPRDLFDIYLFFKNFSFSEKLKQAFIAYLISTNRPVHEVICPNLLNQEEIYHKEFLGMTHELISYKELETARLYLIRTILQSLSKEDKRFLVSIEEGSPDWNLYEASHVKNFPGIQWKIFNVQKMDADKRLQSVVQLKSKLEMD